MQYSASRVLYVVNDLDTGGAQTLIEALVKARVQPSFVMVLLGRGVLSERLERSAEGVFYCHLGKTRPNLFKAIRTLVRLVDELDIDVVHSHLLQSDLVSLLAPHRRKRVSTLHTSGGHESGMSARLVGRAVAAMSRGFQAVVACSASARDYAVSMRYFRAESVVVISNGVRVPDQIETRPGRAQTLLCLSRWHPMKDHRTLIAAAAKLYGNRPGLRLDLAGNDVDATNEALVGLLEGAGIRDITCLHGAVDNVDALFDTARALVISSSHGEALPMAGLEALARGIPVVSTDVGDCRSLVVNNKLLAPPADSIRLAAAIESVLRLDENAYAELRQSAWRLANESFDLTKTMRAYEAVYARL